jgi:predicted secreted protein
MKIVLIFLLLSGCSSLGNFQDKSNLSSADTIQLEAGMTNIYADVGKLLKIQILSNPSTGFRWSLKISAKFSNCFIVSKDGDFLRSSSSVTSTLRVIGAPEFQEWFH